MADRAVDDQGNVYERGWDGQYREKQGLFGPERETDWLGNPKAERDWLGNPKQETNWLGQQQTGSNGRGLFQSGGGGSSSGGDFAGTLATWIVTAILFVAVMALVGLIRLLVSLCRSNPRVGYPLVAALILVPLVLAMLSSVPGSAATPATASGPGVRAQAPAAPTSAPAPAAAAPAAQPAPQPTATLAPVISTGGSTAPLIVANTGGEGVYLRKSPRTDDRIVGWRDGTTLRPTGRTAVAEGKPWVEVQDPSQNVGWVPSQYTSPAPSGSEARRYVVGNTDGQGVFLRRSPNPDDRLYAVPDGTELTATGKAEERGGQRWIEVRDPKGTVGWVPIQYLMAR